MIESITSVFILAVLVEGIVEYFIASEDKKQPWLKYVAAAIGVLVCVIYKADLLAGLGLITPIPYVGSIVTGIIIGRGSNYLNDFISKVRKPNALIAVDTIQEETAAIPQG